MTAIDLLNLIQNYYIALPGAHKHLAIKCQGTFPPEVTHIHILSNLKSGRWSNPVALAELPSCTQFGFMFCLKIVVYSGRHIKTEYFVLGNISSYYRKSNTNQNKYYSWFDANTLCKEWDAELPYFMSMDELYYFTERLGEVVDLPLIEAIFIGLKYNQVKVISFQ